MKNELEYGIIVGGASKDKLVEFMGLESNVINLLKEVVEVWLNKENN